MKFVSLVGSYRKESYNQKIFRFIQTRYKHKVQIEEAPIHQLPMFNQDDELDPPSIVNQVKTMIKSSDGILIITPEYNHSVPTILKNALDWASRVEKVIMKKPVMIVGASPGVLGTVRAQEHLRQILKSPGLSAFTLPGNEVFIGQVHEKLDEQGNLIHQPTIEFLDEVMNNFLDWIEKTRNF